MAIDDIIHSLLQVPITVDDAMTRLPRAPGLYAWWSDHGSTLGVPPCPHPTEEYLDLLYVGIAPIRASSSASMRSRIIGNHLGGNTGASTFRLTLASLLMEELGFTPRRTKTKVALPLEQNQALSGWQEEHLRLSWVEANEPWLVEHKVIGRLGPPLNLAGNSSHPFHARLTEARKRFRAAAKASTN